MHHTRIVTYFDEIDCLLLYYSSRALCTFCVSHPQSVPTRYHDFIIIRLTRKLVTHILSYLPLTALLRATRASKAWRALIESDSDIWENLMKSTNMWFGGEREKLFLKHISHLRRKQILHSRVILPPPHPYKILFKSRYLTRTSWLHKNPWHLIISSFLDNTIRVHSLSTGELIWCLTGHTGEVPTLGTYKDTLVSVSFDCTIRIWDLRTGRCTHVFRGHADSIVPLSVVKPGVIDWTDESGIARRERWPKRPLIVTGRADCTCRVWNLPKASDPEYNHFNPSDTRLTEEDIRNNPYRRHLLEGHTDRVNTVTAQGRTVVSGGADCTVRVWDLITGATIRVLRGHTDTVFSVALDLVRQQAYSGSIDGTVKIWSLSTGQLMHSLPGSISFVGMLGISPFYLVSAALDASLLRVWNIGTGESLHEIPSIGGTTCFQHDEFKILNSAGGALKMWNIGNGGLVREMLFGSNDEQQVAFEGRWCVAVTNRVTGAFLDVFNFGHGIDDEDWFGEPACGLYDDTDSSDEEETEH